MALPSEVSCVHGPRSPLFVGVRVSRVFSSNPFCVDPQTLLTRLRKLFVAERKRVAYACREGRLLGVIDRRHALMVSSRKTMASVATVMEEPFIVFSPEESLERALNVMIDADTWYAPVVDGDRLAGSLGLEDVIRFAVESDPGALERVEARSVMTRDPLAASKDDYVSKIWRYMVEKSFAGLPVVNEKGRLIGIITQYDLLKKGYTRIELESSSGPRKGPRVSEAMNSSPIYAYPWSSLLEVARIIVERDVGRVPIVDAERSLVGIIDREDIVRALLRGGRG